MMALKHVFIETNFLFSIFRLPSQRHRDALALRARFEANEVKLYLPYLCLQEAKHLVGKNLPKHRCSDLLEDFHWFAIEQGTADWNFGEAQKLLDAAAAKVTRTKAVYQSELASFAMALGDGVLHGTREVFDLLESLLLDDELQYNDKLVLSTVLVKARDLQQLGERDLFFVSIDKKNLQPTSARPRLTRYYDEVGLSFIPGFVIPDSTANQV